MGNQHYRVIIIKLGRIADDYVFHIYSQVVWNNMILFGYIISNIYGYMYMCDALETAIHSFQGIAHLSIKVSIVFTAPLMYKSMFL